MWSVLVLLCFLLCTTVLLGRVEAESFVFPFTTFAEYKTEVVNPTPDTYYTDLMPLNFTVEWMQNKTTTWLAWLAPTFGYSIDNDSVIFQDSPTSYGSWVIFSDRPTINFDYGSPQSTAVSGNIDVSNLTHGIHKLTLYAKILAAVGQFSEYNVTLTTIDFQVGSLPSPPLCPSYLTEFIDANIIPIVVGVAAVVVLGAGLVFYRKRSRKRAMRKSVKHSVLILGFLLAYLIVQFLPLHPTPSSTVAELSWLAIILS